MTDNPAGDDASSDVEIRIRGKQGLEEWLALHGRTKELENILKDLAAGMSRIDQATAGNREALEAFRSAHAQQAETQRQQSEADKQEVRSALQQVAATLEALEGRVSELAEQVRRPAVVEPPRQPFYPEPDPGHPEQPSPTEREPPPVPPLSGRLHTMHAVGVAIAALTLGGAYLWWIT